jgi:molybdate transport system substrate-binding protein
LCAAAKRLQTEIKVMSSLAIREAYLELVPQFEKESGHKVVTDWVGMVDIKKRVLAGEIVDLVSGSAAAIDELIQARKLVPGRMDLAKSGVAVAVRAGAPRPDIGSGEALKRSLLAAKSIGYSSGPSGVYLAELFKRMGIAERVQGKITQTPPGTPVGPLIARGEVALGFQQLSELLPTKGIDIIGPLPDGIQIITMFSFGMHAIAKQAEAAKALVRFLTSAAAVPVLKKKGLDPA